MGLGVPVIKRGLDRLAKWWLGPPSKPKRVKCMTCGKMVHTWRTYAGGGTECVHCASGLQTTEAEAE